MIRLPLGLLVGAFLLPALQTAIAQVHKCTDAQGKVSYSDKPCPGSSAVPATPAAPSPQARQPAPAQASAKSKGPDEAANLCAEKWVGVRMRVRAARADAERARIEIARARDMNREKDESRAFVQACGGYGFVPTDSPDGLAANDRTARKIAGDYRVAYERRLEEETRTRAAENPPARPQPNASALSVPARGPAQLVMALDEQSERNWCADEWESEVARKRDMAPLRERQSAASKVHSDRFDKEREKNVMQRLVSRCGKYGMAFPSDTTAARKNDQVAQRLRKEIDSAQAAERTAETNRRVAEDAESRAREDRSRRVECDKMFAQLDAERAKLGSYSAQERVVVEKGIADAERSIRRECP